MSFFTKPQMRARARIKVERIVPLLKRGERLLDIGTGNGAVCQLLTEQGFVITPLDVTNKSKFTSVNPILFDGTTLPFKDRDFDTAFLLTVLHHVRNPEKLLQEASRVANQVIVMEDTYNNSFQKYLTFFADSMVNQEWIGHPHSNKTDQEWKAAFEKTGLKMVKQLKHPRFLFFFQQNTYVLRNSSDYSLTD